MKTIKPLQITLYAAIVAAGIPYSNHESDLYFKITPESTEILKRYRLEYSNRTTFQNRITGERWYDVPFAFVPFWENVSRMAELPETRKVR